MIRNCKFCGNQFHNFGKSKFCCLTCRILGQCDLDASGCLLWSGATRGGKYGVITVDGKARDAHRVAWAEFIGRVPLGMYVCHSCDVPRCCNPNHLFVGTPQDNTDDALRKGRHGMTGKKHSLDTRRVLADRLRANPAMNNPPEKRKQQSEMMKARWRDDPQWKYRGA